MYSLVYVLRPSCVQSHACTRPFSRRYQPFDLPTHSCILPLRRDLRSPGSELQIITCRRADPHGVVGTGYDRCATVVLHASCRRVGRRRQQPNTIVWSCYCCTGRSRPMAALSTLSAATAGHGAKHNSRLCQAARIRDPCVPCVTPCACQPTHIRAGEQPYELTTMNMLLAATAATASAATGGSAASSARCHTSTCLTRDAVVRYALPSTDRAA